MYSLKPKPSKLTSLAKKYGLSLEELDQALWTYSKLRQK